MPSSSRVLLVLLGVCLFLSARCDASEVLDPPWEEGDDDGSSPALKSETIFRAADGGGSGPKAPSRRKKRFSSLLDQDLACEMLVAVDFPLWAHWGRDIANTTARVADLVERLNGIYRRTLFRNEFGHLYFRVKEVRVLFDFCTECNATQRIYLQEFSKMDFSDFCLAHVFTYRDFPEGVQGLAWKGTICHDRWNTGFTTLLNHQVSSSKADSAMTMAHEIGHNLGSDHDENMNCASDYIMSESGSSSVNPQFSSCSINAISSTLRDVLGNPRKNCFAPVPMSDPVEISFCGDGVVEGDEECDCGLSYETCSDPCCYAAHIHANDLLENDTAVPCRTNLKHTCLHPFSSTWKFGFVAPWIMILSLAVIIAVALVYDWRHDKHAYTHVTSPKEMIRSETQEQMARRLARQTADGKTVYVIQSPKRNIVRNQAVSPPPPPAATEANGNFAMNNNGIIRNSARRPTEKPPPPPLLPAPDPSAPSRRAPPPPGGLTPARPLSPPRAYSPPGARPPPPPLHSPPPSAPPGRTLVPQEAKPGLVQQMRERLERSKRGGE